MLGTQWNLHSAVKKKKKQNEEALLIVIWKDFQDRLSEKKGIEQLCVRTYKCKEAK